MGEDGVGDGRHRGQGGCVRSSLGALGLVEKF